METVNRRRLPAAVRVDDTDRCDSCKKNEATEELTWRKSPCQPNGVVRRLCHDCTDRTFERMKQADWTGEWTFDSQPWWTQPVDA